MKKNLRRGALVLGVAVLLMLVLGRANAASPAVHWEKVVKAPTGWSTPFALSEQLSGYLGDTSANPNQENSLSIADAVNPVDVLFSTPSFGSTFDGMFGLRAGQCVRVVVHAWNDPRATLGYSFSKKVCAPTAVTGVGWGGLRIPERMF